jgi:hypothetical protein
MAKTEVQERFAPMREAKVESIEEALAKIKTDFAFTTRPVVINQLSVTDDYKVSIGQDELPITRWGFQNLMTSLHIPATFGEYIPSDLLQTVVSRLKSIDPFGVKLFIDNEGNIINVKKGNYVAPKIERILEKIQGDIKIGRVSARGVRLATILPDTLVEPTEGDKVMIGTVFTASETGGLTPLAKLMSFRHICSNGAIAGDDIGIVRWTARKEDGGMDGFLDGIRHLNEHAGEVVQALKALPTRNLKDAEFSKLWNQVRGFFDAEKTDKIFDVDPEQRKVYLATSNLHKKERGLPGPTEVSAWDVFNNITAEAKGLDFAKSEALMKVGGFLLSMN